MDRLVEGGGWVLPVPAVPLPRKCLGFCVGPPSVLVLVLDPGVLVLVWEPLLYWF